MARSRPRARVGALGVVPRAARDRRVHARATPCALSARCRADLCGVRSRRELLLDRADRAAVVRRSRRRRARRARRRRCAADDGRVRRALLARRLGAALQCLRGQSPRRGAVASLRHIPDGRASARGGGAGRGHARRDVYGDARLRAGLPRRALRRRSARRRRADRRRASARTALCAAGSSFRSRAGGARGDRARRSWGEGVKDELSDPQVEEAMPVGEKGSASEEEMPRVAVTRRQAIAFGLFVLTIVAFFYFVLPKLSGVGTTVHRIERGDTWWIAIGVVLELLSFAGYVALFRAVFVRGHGRIGWPESYDITMAGLAATRLFAAAGAGGVALTAWALRRSGMEPRLVACRMVAFVVLLYTVFAGSLLLDGVGLGTGLFPGGGSSAITFARAIVAAVLLAIAGAVAALPGDVERRLERRAAGSGRLAHWLARAVTGPGLAARRGGA